MIKYENANTKRTEQGCKIRLYLKLTFNKLNVMGNLLYPFGDIAFKNIYENFHKDLPKNFFKSLLNCK